MEKQNICERYLELLKKRDGICITSGDSTQERMITYDVKCEMGYDGDDWQRMCRYKVAEDGFDCDVAELTMLQYAIAFPFVLDRGRRIINQAGNTLKYELRGQSGFVFRGDTMNSYAITVHEFVKRFGSVSGRVTDRYILNNYDALSGLLPKAGVDFIRLNHTIGNFIPVPFVKEGIEFNRPRGTRETKDYWDKALWAIYQWYTSENDEGLKTMLGKEESVALCKEWLEVFGGWQAFVQKNYMQPFVRRFADGSFGEPLELWDNHFSGSVLPQTEGDFEQFFVNARIRILERGKLVVAALKEKLQK